VKWAYLDESIRPGRMVIAAVVVETGDVRQARLGMRSALLPGQRRLHLTDERPARRHLILDLVARQALVAIAEAAPTHGRRHAQVQDELPRKVVRRVAASGARRIVLDRVAEELLEADRATISRALAGVAPDVLYDHLPSTADPLLWAADAVAWAVGAGGHAAARLAPIMRAPDAQHPAAPRPGSQPGALPTPTGVSDASMTCRRQVRQRPSARHPRWTPTIPGRGRWHW